MTDLAVAKAFGRAAHCYDQHAQVQLACCRSLLAMLPDQQVEGFAVDAGAGTASMARQLSEKYSRCHWVALDISSHMLNEAARRGRLDGGWSAVCADATQQPFSDNALSLIYSSFALQWCDSPQQVLVEWRRVMKPGAVAAIAVPVAGTLEEFRRSWQAVDGRIHINRLPAAEDWLSAAEAAGLLIQEAHGVEILEHYQDVRAIGRMLKGTGAYRVRRDQPAGLITPSRYAQLTQAYDAERTQQGLPVTWQVQFILLHCP